MKKNILYIALCLNSCLFAAGTTALDKETKNTNTPLTSPTPWLTSRFDLLPYLPKGGIVAEIGVQRGDFSALILKYAHPQKLYLIDCWEHQSEDAYPGDGGNVENKKQQENYEWVKKRFADDPRVIVIKAYSEEAAQLFENNFFDWIYLDGNHSYEGIKKDLEAWQNKIKPEGLIVGDDYVSPLVRPEFGVVPAVNEFIKKYKLEMLYLTTDTFANWVLKK